jgi:Mg-chelatase subunit ChlD
MNTKIMALGLLVATGAAVVAAPSLKSNATAVAKVPPAATQPRTTQQQTIPKVEAVFVLDTTGSMSGMIDAAKEKIWSIARTMAQAQPTPEIRIGLVAYRDLGDAYVTKVVDLSADLDSMYATLMDFSADGGGDGPESVNRALYDAVNGMSWSQDASSYRVVFLVGDAPPHMDYQNDVAYTDIASAAAAHGIVINTIQCGAMPDTAAHWQRIAALGNGRYFQVEQAGSAVAIDTPYDAHIAALSARLDATRLYYGDADERAAMEQKTAATEKLHGLASVSALARRGVFNVTAAGAANFVGERDLVDDVASGRVDIESVPSAELPPALADLAPEEQRREVESIADRRQSLQKEIAELAELRDAFILDTLDAAGGADASLDLGIYEAVRTQAAPKGLTYESGPRF